MIRAKACSGLKLQIAVWYYWYIFFFPHAPSWTKDQTTCSKEAEYKKFLYHWAKKKKKKKKLGGNQTVLFSKCPSIQV